MKTLSKKPVDKKLLMPLEEAISQIQKFCVGFDGVESFQITMATECGNRLQFAWSVEEAKKAKERS